MNRSMVAHLKMRLYKKETNNNKKITPPPQIGKHVSMRHISGIACSLNR